MSAPSKADNKGKGKGNDQANDQAQATDQAESKGPDTPEEISARKIENMRRQRDESIKARDANAKALKEFIDAVGEEKAESLDAYKMIKEAHDADQAKVEKLEKQIENEEKAQATASYMNPLIVAFGTVEVPDAKSLPANIHVVDVEAARAKAAEDLAKAQSKVTVYDSLLEAVKASGIPEDIQADLRPVRMKPEGETKVTLEVGTRSGPTGPRGAMSTYKITAADDDHQSLVGKVVGKDGDYANWRQLLQEQDPQHYQELESKKAKGSNYSARDKAERRFKLTTEPVES